jgi:drug/metabolite transporter (DMT)-like permease
VILLLLVSLLWAFSFGLIKSQLAGLDPAFVAAVRLLLSLAVFVPFFRPAKVPRGLALPLAAVGAVQFGLMYVAYIASYAHLQAHEVALFTVLTPLHVVLLEALLRREGRGRALLVGLAAAALAVAGAALLEWRPGAGGIGSTAGGPSAAGGAGAVAGGTSSAETMGAAGAGGAVGGAGSPSPWHGFLLVQAANLCFALGQVAWRRLCAGRALPQASVFALPLAGAVMVAGTAALLAPGAHVPELSGAQVATLLYLGLLPSGLGFFLWNLGATRTDAATLAVLNNAKVPLGVLVALLVFGEEARPLPLLGSAALLALALVVGARARPAAAAADDLRG